MRTLLKTRQAGYPTWIECRLDRLKTNLQNLKDIAGNPAVMAVVKANAYGHGLLETARALQGEVSYLGVSSIYEVMELKEHGITTPVFLFGRSFDGELHTAVKSGATLTVSSLDEAREISFMSSQLQKRTPIHVKVDTGMGRLGMPLSRAFKTIEKISLLGGLQMEGIYTHFPSAETEDGFAEKQIESLEQLLQKLDEKGIRFKYRHAANSAGALRLKSPFLNLVRPGLILYGLYPAPALASRGVFAPVLTLKSRIMLVKRLDAGDSVGYSREFTATKPCTIATLAAGYSHGYPVAVSGKGSVLYKGKRYPLAGRVSMDFLCVNFGDARPEPGEEVILIGEDGGEVIRAEDMAAWAGTIPYEIVTRLSPRIPRLYFS